MVMAGVGGKTVEEAKDRLTFWEVQEFWIPYQSRHGSFNSTERMELGFAQLCRLVNHAAGGHARLEDFLPRREGEQHGTPEQVMAILMGKRT
jgi:hypothetical protein